MLTDLIYYDLKVATLIAAFYLFYQLLLARDTTHVLNRAVLLSGIVLSAVLPLCIITFHRTVVVDSGIQPVTDGLAIDDVTSLPVAEALEQTFDWSMLLAVALLAGTVIRLLSVIQSYRKLKGLMRCGEMHTQPTGTRLCVVDAPIAPFSWMQTIVLSRADWTAGVLACNTRCSMRAYSPALSPILVHEEAHVRHRHSYDVVVVEVLTALQWFNPVVWFLRQELRTLHEYEADASVLSRGFDESQYIHLLMQKATGIQACALANGINTHRTKKRILMMLKPKSNRKVWLKALYVVPVTLVSLALTAKTVVDYKTAMPEDNLVTEELIQYNSKMSDAEFVNYVKQQQAAGLKQSDLVQSMLNEGNGISRARILHLNGVYGSEKGNLFIVDGKEVSRGDFNEIKPEAIASVTVMDVGPAKKVYGEKGRYGATIVETKHAATDAAPKEEDRVFDICEQMPSFPGGDAKLMEFIARNIKYPKVATENGVQGRVMVKFIVEKDGSLSNLKVLDNPKSSPLNMVVVTAYMPDKERQDAEAHNAGLQAIRDEALRVVKAMPRWTPGRQNGKVVRCYFVIPVTYRLQ